MIIWAWTHRQHAAAKANKDTPWVRHRAIKAINMTTHLLNEITYRDVIKVINMCPFNAFLDILFLLLSQRQLYEDLLKLLIAVVDDELLKVVFLCHVVNNQNNNVLPLRIQLLIPFTPLTRLYTNSKPTDSWTFLETLFIWSVAGLIGGDLGLRIELTNYVS